MNNGEVLGIINEIIETYQGWLIVKILFLVGIVVYCFFALSVYRQTQLMDKVLKISIRPSFKTIAKIYLIASLVYLILAILFL